MFVLCTTCHNHYDDESQAVECHGPGRSAGSRAGVLSSHEPLRETAIGAHVMLTRAANR